MSALRRAGVKNIACYQYGIHGMGIDLNQQPVKQLLGFACQVLPMKC